jgi:hypothetical protein
MATAVSRRLPEIRSLGRTAGVAVAATAVYLLVSRALIDDAYITMAYARNLAFHLHWGMIADETANSATSPLNVILLGAITAVVRDGVVAVGVLFVASAVLAAHWLAELAADTRLNPALPAVAVGTLLVNPLLLSTVGLEPYLTAALLAGLLRYGVARRPVAFGVLAGLCRAGAAGHRGRRGRGRAGAPPGVAAGDRGGARGHPALVRVQLVRARLGAAGHAADEGQRRLGRVRVLERAGALPAQVPGGHGAVVPARARRAGRVGRAAGRAPAGGVGAGRHRGRPWRGRPLRRLLPAAHRALPLVLRPVDHRDDALRGDRRRPRAVGGGGGRRAGLRRAGGRPAARRAVDPRRDLDELGHGRRVRADGHRRGADRRRGRGREPGEIGTLAYYCDCTIVDAFSDRGRIIPAIEARERAGGLGSALLRLNYLHLDRDQAPRPVEHRLRYEAHKPPAGPEQWRVDHWVDGPGRIVLER